MAESRAQRVAMLAASLEGTLEPGRQMGCNDDPGLAASLAEYTMQWIEWLKDPPEAPSQASGTR
jgi:hypothetical protein